MECRGNFNYFFNNESKTREEIVSLISDNTTVSIKGLDVFYSSPKINKTDQLLKEAEQQQEKNGGRVKSEFLLDEIVTGFEWFPILKSIYIEKNVDSNKIFYDYCYSEINKFIHEELVKKHTDGKTVLPREFQAVAGDLNNKYLNLEEVTKILTKEREQKVINNWNKVEGVNEGIKETKGKLDYELDWEFIQQMAERMNQNKGKYEPYNWKKLIDVEKLKQSLFRHTIEIMKGNDSDDGRTMGHYESLALNAMMICYQLKNKFA